MSFRIISQVEWRSGFRAICRSLPPELLLNEVRGSSGRGDGETENSDLTLQEEPSLYVRRHPAGYRRHRPLCESSCGRPGRLPLGSELAWPPRNRVEHKEDETDAELNTKLEKLQRINQLSCLIAFGGLISLLHDK